MDSFELNKIIGAILGTLLFVMGVGFLADAIYAPIEGHGVGYTLPEPAGTGHGGEVVAEVEVVPLSVLLANASVERGVKVIRKCASCHNFGDGDANKTGPALYGIVGKPIATHEFGYSDALASLGEDGQIWTYDALNEFLTSPKAFAPGTKMTFAGLRSEKDRANLLAYLQTLASNRMPFPAVEEMMDEEMPAEGEAEAAAHN